VDRSELTPVDDVVAVPPSLTQELTNEPTIELPGSEELRANGWRFVRGDADQPGLRAVYRDKAGHVSIEGATVVVRFDDDAAKEQIDEVLRSHKLTVRRPIAFVPKGFQVAFEGRPAKGQLLRISKELEKLDCVRYADPDFVEELGPR
jgi:hypothetical protein